MDYIKEYENFINEGKFIWNQVGDRDDQKQLNSVIERAKKVYSKIARKSVSLNTFEKEVSNILSKHLKRKKPYDNESNKAWMDEVTTAFPIAKTNSGWMGYNRDYRNLLNTLRKITIDAKEGNTSMYGYKVHKK